jgi:23S rRNA (uracil1939-C5)-methyltransferase
MKRRETYITVTIEKLIFGGQGLANHEGKKVFVWNALPGEKVDALVYEKKRTYSEAIATKIHTPSPDRITPNEDHHMSCSPWQIITPETEMEWKNTIAREMFEHAGLIRSETPIEIYNDLSQQYEYRNKMEFSFMRNTENKISLAFYQRGRHNKIGLDTCRLATPYINQVAEMICQWLSEHRFPIRSLKTLIVRSNNRGEAIAALFVKDMLSIIKTPELISPLKGFHIYYSNPKSPASRPDKLLSTQGPATLTNDVLDTQLTFGLLSFFQINYHAYLAVLTDIKRFLDQERELIDYYSGVGALSIPLHNYYRKAHAVELNEEAINFAHSNISNNELSNYQIHHASTEKALEYIDPNAVTIFDPPRSGIHPKIIKKIIDVKPYRIIYLSCNISTQTRDIQPLLDHYSVSFVKLYNFFPRTPHIESLYVLDKKD